jgi:hypothetical protein
MVNNKGPSSVRKQRASVANVCGAHETFKRFTAGNATIFSNGSEMGVTLIAQREMPPSFAAIVNAFGHDKVRRS